MIIVLLMSIQGMALDGRKVSQDSEDHGCHFFFLFPLSRSRLDMTPETSVEEQRQ